MLQQKLLSVFHYALNPNGFLVLGQAETRRRAGDAVLARRQEAPHLPQEGRRATAPTMTFPVDHASAGLPRGRSARRRRIAEPRRCSRARSSRVILDRYAPPGVVVDADLQIVQFRGQTGRVPRAGARRGEPEPAEDGARGAALRAAHGAAGGAQEPRRRCARPDCRCGRATAGRRSTLEVIPLADGGTRCTTSCCSTSHAPQAARAARPRRGRRRRRHAARGREGRRASAAAAARAGGQPRVPPVDHPGARSRQRGAAVGQRGDPLEQRGAAERPTRSSTRRRRSCSRPTRS